MAKRSRMTRQGSKRQFTRDAGVHPKNNNDTPMRGGIRL